MSLTLYKPNSKNLGCAFSFRAGINKNKEPTIYVSAIQQFSWDSSKKTGNFSGNRDNPDKNINIKFNEFEIGGILSAFKNRHEYSTFHAFDDNKTSIKLTPWDKPNKNGGTLPAFGIVLSRNGNQVFKLPLEPGEVEAVSHFFKSFFSDLFSHRKREEIKARKNSKEKQENKNSEDAPF